MSDKIYDVPAEWQKRGLVDDAKYQAMYDASIKDPDKFWAEHGKRVDWIKPFSKIKNANFGPGDVSIKWFEDGTLNACFNCVDRHLEKRGGQTAGAGPDDDHVTLDPTHAVSIRIATSRRVGSTV